jgi:hypothetical protein
MKAGTISTPSSWKHFARYAMASGLLASTTGCVVIVRNLDISRIEPAQLVSVLVAPDSNQSGRSAKQALKLQYEDGASVLFRGSVLLAGDSLVGNGLRASPDALRAPSAVGRMPSKGIVGAMIFRERTNAGASVAASVVGTAATLAVLGFIAMSMADSFDRAIAEALSCALGSSYGYTCSLSPSRMLAPWLNGSRVRGGGAGSPTAGLRSPGQPLRGVRQ